MSICLTNLLGYDLVGFLHTFHYEVERVVIVVATLSFYLLPRNLIYGKLFVKGITKNSDFNLF